MPVSRGTYEALKAAHAALKAKHRQTLREQETGRRADTTTATTITRLTAENTSLRHAMASHIRSMERDGLHQMATALRTRLLDAGIDLTVELASGWEPGENALPPTRTYTPTESRLLADLRRRNAACGSLETQLLEQQGINEALNMQLRQYREAAQGMAS